MKKNICREIHPKMGTGEGDFVGAFGTAFPVIPLAKAQRRKGRGGEEGEGILW